MSYGFTPTSSAECKNHPGTPAFERCAGCAEAFCPNCLIDMGGRKYCASCKMLAVRGRPMVEIGTIPCKEANDALIMAIIGLILSLGCIGIVLNILAITKASTAKKMIEANPMLTGSGKAQAAMTISIIGLVIAGLAIFGGVIAEIAKSS